MKLNNILTNRTVSFSKEFNGEIVEWGAKENALSPKILQSFIDVQTRPIELANGLAAVITGWNVYQEKEGDFPPTVDNLSTLPVEFLNFILTSMAETWQGGKPQGASPNGSAA